MNLVTLQPISSAGLLRDPFYKGYKDSCFFHLLSGYSMNDTDQFIHCKGITFRDYIGCQLLSGNELICYPGLARELRLLEDYPILKRCYKVDQKVEGLAFIEYFCQHVKDCYKEFEAELNQATYQVNQLIAHYGQERLVPILDNIPYDNYQDALIIYGMKWPIEPRFKSLNPARCLNLYRLLEIPDWVANLSIEKTIAKTPFIAVRIREQWKNKGHVQWYSLDTRQPVSQKEIAGWKTPV